MEGYLNKRARGEMTFGRRNWKKRWFILEDTTLSYYDYFNLETNKPVTLKGTIDLFKCEVSVPSNSEKNLLFTVKPIDGTALQLEAPDPKILNSWMKAITAAASGESLYKPIDYMECRRILGLDLEKELTPAEVTKAYRKTALKVHPDKGGDLVEFKKLQEASDVLIKKLEEEELFKKTEILEFEAVILKGPPGVGLGMIVIEDTAKRTITVKSALPEMTIRSIDQNSGGSIKPGDRLVKVRNEDVAEMPLLRVVQKINEFRVPVNTTCQLTFQRLQRMSGTDDINDIDEDEYDPKTSDDDPVVIVTPPPFNDPDDDDNDDSNIPATSHFSTPSYQQPTQSSQHHKSANNTMDTASEASNRKNARRGSKNYNKPPTLDVPPIPAPTGGLHHVDPVVYAPLIGENEELKREIEFHKREIESMKSDKKSINIENQLLKSQLQRQKMLLTESFRRQKMIQLQLEDYLMGNAVTRVINTPDDHIITHLNTQFVNDLSKYLQLKDNLQVSPEIEKYLEATSMAQEQNGDGNPNYPSKDEQQVAIKIVASIDPTRATIQRWALSGDSAMDKLNRIEEKFQTFDVNALSSKSEQKNAISKESALNPAELLAGLFLGDIRSYIPDRVIQPKNKKSEETVDEISNSATPRIQFNEFQDDVPGPDYDKMYHNLPGSPRIEDRDYSLQQHHVMSSSNSMNERHRIEGEYPVQQSGSRSSSPLVFKSIPHYAMSKSSTQSSKNLRTNNFEPGSGQKAKYVPPQVNHMTAAPFGGNTMAHVSIPQPARKIKSSLKTKFVIDDKLTTKSQAKGFIHSDGNMDESNEYGVTTNVMSLSDSPLDTGSSPQVPVTLAPNSSSVGKYRANYSQYSAVSSLNKARGKDFSNNLFSAAQLTGEETENPPNGHLYENYSGVRRQQSKSIDKRNFQYAPPPTHKPVTKYSSYNSNRGN